MSIRNWSWRRRLLAVFGGLVVLIVVAAIAVPLLVPAERWKNLAFEQLEKQTQLVGSAESASVSLIPLGLEMRGLRIEDPQGTTQLEDFEFALESVVVRASLLSILRGAPEVAEVKLVRPELEFRLPATPSGAQGGDVVEGGQGSADASANEVALVLALLSIEDGHVIVHDPAGTRIELSGLQNRASLRTASGVLEGELEGGLERAVVSGDSLRVPLTLPPSSWQLVVRAQMDGSGGTATVERIEIAGASTEGTVSWAMGADDLPELDVALDVRADLARLWTEFLRDRVDPKALPAPWTLDDFEILAGNATMDLGMQGALPQADPGDPSAVLRPLRAQGSVSGVKLRLLDRSDLAEIDAQVKLEDAVLHLDDVRLRGALGTVNAAMNVALSLTQPLRGTASADLDVGAVRALGEQWWPRLAELAGEEATGPDEWPQLSGRVQADLTYAVPADGSFDPLTAPADAITWQARTGLLTAGLPTLTEPVHVRDARLQGDLKHAELERARIEGPGLVGDATLQFSGWPEATVVEGTVTSPRVDLDALQAAMVVGEETASLAPSTLERALGVRTARAQAESDAMVPPPANLRVDVRMRADEVLSSGYTLRQVEGHATLVEQELQVQEIAGQLGTGSIDGAAAVDWTVSPPQWSSDLRANEVPATALLEPIAGPLANALTTKFSGRVDLDGPLALEPAQILTALTGAIAMQSSQGSFEAESLLGPTVSKFLGDAADKWRSIDFSSLTANMSVNDGRVHFDKVFLTGTTELQAQGSVGLDGTPNYRLDVRLPRGITPQLGALEPVADLLRDDQGRIVFGVNVTGEAKKPKVEIDLADLQKRAERAGEARLRNELRDRLGDSGAREKLDEALGGKLDQLLGGTKSGAAPADSAATDSTVTDPKQQLEDKAKDAAGSLLDRLKGRKKGGGGED